MGEPKKKPRGRLAGLRFKKKDMPGGLWLKCPSCDTTIYRKELEAKGHTCPSCSFHFTVPGRERVAMTLDSGTWNEMFADLEASDRLEFTDAVPYSEKIARTVEKSGEKEALICGTGDILGRPVVLAVLDFKFLGGSMGEVVGEKVSLAADVARVRNLPLILFTSSGGARMHEGMLSLMQMAKTCSALAEFNSAGGFSICVQTNPTTGGVTASFASVCDLTLAEPGALIGFAGPRVIKTTIKQELPPGFQRAEFLLEKGQVDSIIAREDLVGMLAKLIDFGTAGRPPAPAQDCTGDDVESGDEPGEAAADEEAGSGSDEEVQASPPAPEMDSGDAIPRPEQA
ncbi:MAG TPA: acetyl-CoA carboxylase, carboxyltransferase subunit beta [Planctomycetota bacterium]|nr:acetyl-CoA carboxylase, carboxyltransferase subunit beta [Planctomycetota bacterium]